MRLALTTRRRVPAAAILLALSLTACGSNDENVGRESVGSGSGSMPGMEGATAEPASAASTDEQFLVAMVPHHQSASDMAQIAVRRATNPQVKALAQRIIDAQSKEIAEMTEIAETEYDTTPSTEMMESMSHEMMGMTMTMDMSSDMAMLESSADVDRTFLELMIPHHASALMMADEQIKNGENPEVVALAEKIKADQAKEIGEMQQLLTTLA